jgi:hypothetical protein
MMLQAILAAVLALGAPSETASDVATAVAKYARTPDEAAFLLAWGTHESHFQRRIIDGDCKKWECDHGRARGAFQLHAGAAGSDWALLPGDIDLQAKHAAAMARWAMRTCPKDPVRGGFRVLGGLGCDRALKGEDARVISFRKARAAL